MLNMLILVCAVSIPSADCQPRTALDIIRGPDVASPVECGLYGQAYVAETALAGRNSHAEYLKIVCAPPGALTALLATQALPSDTAVAVSSPR
jgi:hypothetical protein